MKTNQGTIILAERAAEDHGRVRAVLSEWGYRESEIQRFLKEPQVEQKLDSRLSPADGRPRKIAHRVS